MLTISELHDRIGGEFPDVERVSDTAVRFSRVLGKRAYAVCYVDVMRELPSTVEALTEYQDRVIGRYYFEGHRSLQWSNYLYFLQPEELLDSPVTLNAKQLIEADRTYARKFVLGEDELEEVLKPPLIEAPQTGGQTNVMATWTRRLIQPGLYDAVFKDIDMPKRLALIERPGVGQSPPTGEGPLLIGPSKPPPFIKGFKIRKYRNYPARKEYDFGKVNLIFGPNAVGKTSLLEAIELYYCGRNNRNPGAGGDYSFRAELADGSVDLATHARRQQFFRDRNLAWYGQPELKKNTLYRSFSLFNFLDTDAAVSITESTADLEDNLSRLLVGPDAAKIWRNIERLSEALATRVREITTRYNENRAQRDRIAAQLEAEQKLPQESAAIKTRLDAMLRKLKWHYPPTSDAEDEAATLASALLEYASLLEQAGSLAWVPSPTTLNGLNAYCTNTQSALESAETLTKQWATLEAERTKSENEFNTLTRALEQAREARLLIEANVPTRHIEAGRHREDEARIATQLAGTEAIQKETLQEHFDLTLKAARLNAAAARDAAKQMLQQNRKLLKDFTTLRAKSVNLAQQLRAIADEMLQNAGDPNECPLCHATYPAGELANHIHAGLDDNLESTAQALHQQVRIAEEALERASLLMDQVELISTFVARADGPSDITINEAFKLLDERRSGQKRIASSLANVEAELRELAGRNLSYRRFDTIIAQLERLGHPLNEHTLQGTSALVEKLTTTIHSCQDHLQALDQEIQTFQSQFALHLRATAVIVQDAYTLIGREKERLTTTQTLLSRLAMFAANFPWPQRSPLANLVVSARSVRSVAAELQTVLERERQRQVSVSEAVEHKEQLDKRLAQLEPVKDRLIAARDTLADLKEKNSLTDAMAVALSDNRAAIEAIFARIHAPPEFDRLGSRTDTLIRKNGQEAQLKEISTGQRAAYALSIFLARNNQAQSAPPVILIDDPIAHVDDFNALSFLDYLRTLAIERDRQIFFATANDKIAALFERKFDFLEDDFRRFNLSREAA